MKSADLHSAEALLEKVDKEFRCIFSPALQATQLRRWGLVHAAKAPLSCVPTYAAKSYVSALLAFERARALHPPIWREVRMRFPWFLHSPVHSSFLNLAHFSFS